MFERRFAEKIAVGHVGTLDPAASGVLPLALGKATRLIPLIEDKRKAYAFTLVLGRSTDSGDATGATLRETAVPRDAESLLRALLPRFTGRLDQVPPMVSALHHAGRRLYDLAREGIVVERAPRRITIYALDLLGYADGVARLTCACSEGTYIRTLCEDLGTALGCAAHMGALLREASGPFVLYESAFIDDIADDPPAFVIPPERVIALPTIVLDGRGAADFRAGRMVPLPQGATAKHVFVRDSGRVLVGVGEALGALLAPRKVFV